MEAVVTRVMPWMRAFPDRVAFASFSTELGEVNICLYAYKRRSQYNKHLTTETTQPKRESDSWKAHSRGHQDRIVGSRIPALATDRQRLPIRRWQVSFVLCIRKLAASQSSGQRNILRITPVHTSGAEKSPCSVVVESTVCLDIAWKRRV